VFSSQQKDEKANPTPKLTKHKKNMPIKSKDDEEKVQNAQNDKYSFT